MRVRGSLTQCFEFRHYGVKAAWQRSAGAAPLPRDPWSKERSEGYHSVAHIFVKVPLRRGCIRSRSTDTVHELGQPLGTQDLKVW